MPEHIPWERAKQIAYELGCRQVILLAYDGERSHVVTYGQSIHDSEQAARGGNLLKRALGWPEQLCQDESPRVLALQDQVRSLRKLVDETLTNMQTLSNLSDDQVMLEIIEHVAGRLGADLESARLGEAAANG